MALFDLAEICMHPEVKHILIQEGYVEFFLNILKTPDLDWTYYANSIKGLCNIASAIAKDDVLIEILEKASPFIEDKLVITFHTQLEGKKYVLRKQQDTILMDSLRLFINFFAHIGHDSRYQQLLSPHQKKLQEYLKSKKTYLREYAEMLLGYLGTLGPGKISTYQGKWESKTTNERFCENCQKKESLQVQVKICSRCKKVCYCSKECQTEHWKVHKPNCKPQ